MYIVWNAVKNLGRNKGRNILIAAITLAITATTVVSLTINNAAAKSIDDIRLDIGSKVDIGQDLTDMREAGLDMRADSAFISIADFESFGESAYLRDTVFSAEMFAWSDTFFAVDDEARGTGTRTNQDGSVVLMDTLKLVATSRSDALPDFGTDREISDGRMFGGLDEAIISQEIAGLNGTTVGDTISVKSNFSGKTFDLTVVGIYSDTTPAYVNERILQLGAIPMQNRRNEIITSWDTLLAADWESNEGLNITTAYYLKNPGDVVAFEAEVRDKGLPVTYNVAINQDALDKVSGPLSSMKGAVTTFLVIILVLGGLTLALISFLAVRERKYEVGVLRAMGLGKAKVAAGLLAEAVIVTALCLGVGLGAGTAMAQPIATGILDGNVAEAQAADAANAGPSVVLINQNGMDTSDEAEGFEPKSEIAVSLNSDVLTQIVLIALGLAALSGVIGVGIITRYEPLKILRERN
jgi:putative ABC transport system permease protein